MWSCSWPAMPAVQRTQACQDMGAVAPHDLRAKADETILVIRHHNLTQPKHTENELDNLFVAQEHECGGETGLQQLGLHAHVPVTETARPPCEVHKAGEGAADTGLPALSARALALVAPAA